MRSLRPTQTPTRSTVVSLVALAMLALLLIACGATRTDEKPLGDNLPPGFFPTEPATNQAQSVQSIYNLVFVIATAVFVLVEGLLLWIVIRYRRRPMDAELPRQTHGNNFLEMLWTVIPAVVVAVLFWKSMESLGVIEARASGTAANQPASTAQPGPGESPQPGEPGTGGTPGVTVDVTAFQFQWTFAYPEHDLTFTGAGTEGPIAVVPVGEPVLFRLTSVDVNHAFYVPQFLFKRDVIPGRVNEFEVVIRDAGTYTGQCAEFCGLSHAEMFFTVDARPRADFDAWVRAEQDKARATPSPEPTGAAGESPGAGTTLDVSASNAESFDQSTLVAPADTPFTIAFTNNDELPHNVAIRSATPQGDFTGEPLAQAGESVSYEAPALAVGQYEFYCSVHPNMTGTLNVE